MIKIATHRRRRGRLATAVALAAAVGGLAALLGAGSAPSTASAQTLVTYEPSDAIIANPERGFYHHVPYDCFTDDFDEAVLRGYRDNEQITQVLCLFLLNDYRDGPIDQPALDQFQQQADTLRAAGLKMVLRFAYATWDDAGAVDPRDAPVGLVLDHLDQLEPYLAANSDVISVVQAGLIGTWGEWWYTENFGNEGNVTEADWANRKAVVDKLLSVLPEDRMVQLRTPNYKRTMYGPDALPPDQAYDGSANARLGQHNDCFLAPNNDQGTWLDPAVEQPYVEAETRYLPMGGETCQPNGEHSECDNAQLEMARFHYSYLNIDYNQDVLGTWEPCMANVQRSLGYRFALTEGMFPDTAAPGGTLPIELSLTNQGWAAPYNPRDVNLILRNTATGDVHSLPVDSDPRYWAAGEPAQISQALTLPADLPAGTYALLLELPDPEPSLSSRPEYKIQLANTGLWEPGTGYNDLLHTLTVQ